MARPLQSLIAAIEDGLPLTARPYAAVAERLGVGEETVLEMLGELIDAGVIKRLGVVVRHHELGYRANAMVVWDVPDERVDTIGACLAGEPAVTLCYRRPRRRPRWPYNLYCMVHGRDRASVQATIDALRRRAGVEELEHCVLFSRRRFKQNGARYAPAAPEHRSAAHG